jgi:hypothetical protein
MKVGLSNNSSSKNARVNTIAHDYEDLENEADNESIKKSHLQRVTPDIEKPKKVYNPKTPNDGRKISPSTANPEVNGKE